MNVFDRMSPILTHTEKMCQGDNKNENWRLARKNQSKQNLIMRGLITREQLLTEYGGDPPSGSIHVNSPRSHANKLSGSMRRILNKRQGSSRRLVFRSDSRGTKMGNMHRTTLTPSTLRR